MHMELKGAFRARAEKGAFLSMEMVLEDVELGRCAFRKNAPIQ